MKKVSESEKRSSKNQASAQSRSTRNTESVKPAEKRDSADDKLYFALDELHGVIGRAKGLLSILGNRYAEVILEKYPDEEVTKLEANCLDSLGWDVAQLLEAKFQTAWGEFKALRSAPGASAGE